jgi:hypothetical protein
MFFHYQGEDFCGLSGIHMALRSTPFQRELTQSFFAECVLYYALPFNKRTLEHNNKNNFNNIQRRAIRRQFEHISPTLLKDPLSAWWVYCLPCSGWDLIISIK